jgi:hypothetical protein
MDASTPRFTHKPDKLACAAEAIVDFPERGAPFRITIWPGTVTLPVWRNSALLPRPQ